MLSFRKIDYDQDLEQIINLIQENLDHNFSLECFLWKHLENPFGRSYGLLALDNEKIVGLRMFMFWKFQKSGDKKVISAIRPVDTVVDKRYRGQGLFKRLTLKGLEECRESYEFIFNTPNDNSLPGYLKMGWQKIEQVNYIKISLVNPFLKSLQFKDLEVDSIDHIESAHCHISMSTYRSSAYFKWRYKSDTYKIAYFPKEGVYIAFSISAIYVIIYEIFGNIVFVSNKMLYSLARKKRKPLIYYYNNEHYGKLNLPLSIKRRLPVVVIKNHEAIRSSNHVNFSLADLEAVF